MTAGARGPPWRQKARLQAKEPHKLASGRMRRGANPHSVLHSDTCHSAPTPFRCVATGALFRLFTHNPAMGRTEGGRVGREGRGTRPRQDGQEGSGAKTTAPLHPEIRAPAPGVVFLGRARGWWRFVKNRAAFWSVAGLKCPVFGLKCLRALNARCLALNA
jgi:hypothetical protein